MVSAEKFKALKQVSISKDPEKSKVRIAQVFKNTTKSQKEEIKELTGFSNFNNYYNAGKSGVASPKIVVSLATITNVSAKYLTGETDEKGTCDAAEIAEIFANYSTTDSRRKSRAGKTAKAAPVKAAPAKAVAEPKAKSAKAAAPKAAPKAAPQKAAPKAAPKAAAVKSTRGRKPRAAVLAENAVAAAPVAKAAVAKAITLESDALVKLLESLSIRAKYSVNAADTFRQVKELLLK
ncbi:MAG: hypothetical protein FWD35_01745 [Oscillospiraceae bacterium]|nr:hypothetical protein [Oscillospiraceae bacterium]